MRRTAQQPVVGIDLGGTHCQVGVVEADGRITGRARGHTGAERGADAVVATIASLVRDAAAAAGADLRGVAGVGIGAPGAIDHARGVVVEAPNLRWRGYPLAERLSAALGGSSVVVENDVNAAVLGEATFGAGRGERDVFGVWIGTGVGGGLVLDGELWRGPGGSAGEIGQTVLLPRDVEGRRRLEETCSRASIGRRIADLVRANQPSRIETMLREGETLDELTSSTLAAAYRAGDTLVRRVIDESMDLLAAGIANVLSVLGMHFVVVGGGLTEAMGDVLVPRLGEAVRRETFPTANPKISVVATQLGDNAGLLGAAAGAWKSCSPVPRGGAS